MLDLQPLTSPYQSTIRQIMLDLQHLSSPLYQSTIHQPRQTHTGRRGDNLCLSTGSCFVTNRRELACG